METPTLHPLKLWLRTIVVWAASLVSVLSLLGFLGRFNWVLDLCSHFRVQYGIALGILGSALLMLRYRKTAFGVLLIAGLNGALLLPLFIGAQNPKQAGSPTLRVMLLNVNTRTGDPKLVRKAIEEANPDVLVRIKTPGNGLRIVATHPTPPTSREYSRYRDRQLDQLPSVLGPPWPLILVGDLNVTPWSSHFQRLIQRTGLKDTSKGRWFHPTWPKDNWFLGIPIDHVLHSPDITVINRRVGSDVASDHFPVVVDIVVPPTAADRASSTGDR